MQNAPQIEFGSLDSASLPDDLRTTFALGPADRNVQRPLPPYPPPVPGQMQDALSLNFAVYGHGSRLPWAHGHPQ